MTAKTTEATNTTAPTRRRFFKKRFEFWLKKRLPAQSQQTLSHRSIFIFPSRFGLLYLLVSLFLFILGTNYQNNLILLMAFIQISFFITAILFSFANLSGLTIKSGQTSNAYVNDMIQIPLYLSQCTNRNTLTFWFAGNPEVTLDLADDLTKVSVPFKPKQRGLLNPGRVSLKSYFPLGLFKCWTHLDLAIEILVYPQPLGTHAPMLQTDLANERMNNDSPALDDFIGIRDYVPGESLSRISWKHVARQQTKLVCKQFNDSECDPLWLSLNQIPGSNNENKLSKLTFAVNFYSQQNILFGLDLNKSRIEPSVGDEHRLKCLEALALW